MTSTSTRPRKVLLRLTDDEWNQFRAAAVGRHGMTAGHLAGRLVLEYMQLPADVAIAALERTAVPAASVVDPRQLSLPEPARARRKRASAPKKETNARRRT